ncbi:nucleotidyl transferase AbiEii/AbiGii toxin family protein [Curtobacterium sp. SP.BCp]|uniref:nucleotidyl transferase AbiEii/AbiGii toxin family protein n=1 Tax=Curtobacterium sp. SP.BCp TaxID=3435230 RepID=UPI003F73A30B
MSRPDTYASPAATLTAIRAAAKNDGGKTGVRQSDLPQLLLFDRFLARVFVPADAPFVLKGGTRMLAFIPHARATVDIDLEVARYGVDAAIDKLAELVAVDIGDRLRFDLVSRDIRGSGDDQPNVAMAALKFGVVGTTQQVKIDLAVHDRAGAATVRAAPAFRVPLARPVPSPEYVMIALEQQIADKVAAMMERGHVSGPRGDGRSSRAKDLVDLALIAQHLTVDAANLAAALQVQVDERQLEPFTEVDASDGVRTGYPTVAKKVPSLALTWQEALALTNRLIAPVLTGEVVHGTWRPEHERWTHLGPSAQHIGLPTLRK